METKPRETQAYQIGDAVTVDLVGEIIAIDTDPFTKRIEYKVSFEKNGRAWVTADALLPAPVDKGSLGPAGGR